MVKQRRKNTKKKRSGKGFKVIDVETSKIRGQSYTFDKKQVVMLMDLKYQHTH